MALGLQPRAPAATQTARLRWPGARSSLAPSHIYYVNTLGIALYRAGNHAEAIAILEQFLAGPRAGHGGFELFYLAMAYHKQGKRDQAHACLDRALRWAKSQGSGGDHWSRQFAELRTEAETVLAGPTGELPVYLRD